MSYTVEFVNVSTTGLESSPLAPALAGLRANEARYFANKYDHTFVTHSTTSREGKRIVAYVHHVLDAERGLRFAAKPLEAAECEVDGIRWSHVFYEDGLAFNVLYTLAEGGKRAVGFKLSEGMEVPAELAPTFKFARQKSKLAGVIRGSFFVVKGSY